MEIMAGSGRTDNESLSRSSCQEERLTKEPRRVDESCELPFVSLMSDLIS